MLDDIQKIEITMDDKINKIMATIMNQNMEQEPADPTSNSEKNRNRRELESKEGKL